jgi:hypothetical protein
VGVFCFCRNLIAVKLLSNIGSKGLAIWPHFEFNNILILHVLSMCFMLYCNGIVCNVCYVAPTLVFRH